MPSGALSLGMADGACSAEDSPDDDSVAVRVQLPDIGSAWTTTATWAVRVQLPDIANEARLLD